MRKIKIFSTDTDRGPHSFSVGNRDKGYIRVTVPYDKFVEVPDSIISAVKGANVTVVEPDLDYNATHPHAMGTPGRTRTRTVQRFNYIVS